MEKDKITHPFIDWAHATPRGYYGRHNIELFYYFTRLDLTSAQIGVFMYVYTLQQRAKEPQPVTVCYSEVSEKLHVHKNSVPKVLKLLCGRKLLKRVNKAKKGVCGLYVVNTDTLFEELDRIRNE